MTVFNRTTFLAGTASTFASIALIRGEARAAEFEYKYAHNLPIGHPLHTRMVEMWSTVKRETNGRLDVKIFPNNQLGGDPAALTQLRSGALQFFTASGGLFGSVSPVASIENVGFAFRDAKMAFATLDGPLGSYIRAETASKGLVVFGKIWDNGFRQITTSTKPIRTVADLAGFKIRTPPGKLWVDLFRELGAAPTPIPGSELYTALQTRVVDGQENALAGIETTRLYEVQKYLSVTNHMFAGYWPLANPEAWKALGPDVQAVVTRNADRYAILQRRDVELLNASLADKLTRRGLSINTADTTGFRSRLGGFYAKYKSEFGATAWSLLENASGRLA